jgi:hypothetical protein
MSTALICLFVDVHLDDGTMTKHFFAVGCFAETYWLMGKHQQQATK